MKELDLWGKIELDSSNENDPFAILNRQAELFEKKTKDILFIKLIKINLNDNTLKYPLATNFNIVSPRLDNYSYTLFSIYSKVEKDYPLSIECNYLEGNTSKTDTTYNYDCNNEEEFIETLRKILQSSEVKKIISTLYNKSLM